MNEIRQLTTIRQQSQTPTSSSRAVNKIRQLTTIRQQPQTPTSLPRVVNEIRQLKALLAYESDSPKRDKPVGVCVGV